MSSLFVPTSTITLSHQLYHVCIVEPSRTYLLIKRKVVILITQSVVFLRVYKLISDSYIGRDDLFSGENLLRSECNFFTDFLS